METKSVDFIVGVFEIFVVDGGIHLNVIFKQVIKFN
jgi:hypothetical protein